jgi:hypothetical protein
MPNTPPDPLDSKYGKGEPDAGNAKGNRVKGINFIMFLDAVARIYGVEAKQRLEKEASGELGDALKFGGIVAGGWYNIGLYRSLWRLFGEQLNLDDAGVRLLSQKATALGVNIVYRTLARLTTPTLLISAGKHIFRNYFENGQLDVLESKTGELVIEFSQCYGFDDKIWNHVIGGCLYFLEAAGAKGVGFRVLAGGGKTSKMRVTFTYRS